MLVLKGILEGLSCSYYPREGNPLKHCLTCGPRDLKSLAPCNLRFLGVKIQGPTGPTGGQQQRRKPPLLHHLDTHLSGLRWLKAA